MPPRSIAALRNESRHARCSKLEYPAMPITRDTSTSTIDRPACPRSLRMNCVIVGGRCPRCSHHIIVSVALSLFASGGGEHQRASLADHDGVLVMRGETALHRAQ